MALLPPEDQYQQRINSAWLSHVAKGLRTELQNDGIPDSTPDEDVVRFYRDTYAPDTSPEEFESFLNDTYSPDFKAPSESLGERAGGLVRGVAHAAPGMGRQLVEQVGAEGIAKTAAKGVQGAARIIGAPILGGSYLARMAAQMHAGDELSKIAADMPEPDITALQKHYFTQLSPSLEARGYTPEQVVAEVQRRVRGVVRGYTMTQSSLMGDIEHTSEDLLTSAAEGIANVGLMGAGTGLFKNALLAGARRAAGERGAKAVTGTLAGRLVTHAVTGGALGAGYGALSGATEAGGHATAAGESVVPAVAGGAITGGFSGGAMGAALAGPLGVGLEAVGRKAMVDAAATTPKAPEPLLEMAVGEALPKPPLEITGATPGVQQHPVGSQGWWDAYHGVEPKRNPLRTPLGEVEGAGRAPAPEELAPRLPAPELGPPLEGPPRGRVEPIELPRPLVRPEPDAGLAAARVAGEPHSISLPSEPVERLHKAIMMGGGKIEGAKVSVRPSVDGTRLVIENVKGAEHGSGASGKALDRIIASADGSAVPLDVTVTDYAGPRGGTISAEKVAQWYERRGFTRTNETPGSIALHRPVRDPNPPLTPDQLGALAEHHIGEAHPDIEQSAQLEAFLKRAEGLSEPRAFEALGNVEEGKPMIRGEGTSGQPSMGMRLGGWLDGQATAADARINSKLGRMSAGFDPTLIGDYAIKAAAKMYRLGYTAYKSLRTELLKEHPGIPDKAMKDIFKQAREIIQTRLQGDKVSVTKLTRLLEAAEEGRPGADWYDKTAGAVSKMFGSDGDMFLRFLAATSAGKAADANVTMALKAYGQWKLGLPFDGFMGNDQRMLEQASRGEVFGERKLQSILAALRGDENAVAIDRHVMRALGFEKAGAGKGNMTEREYDFFEAVLRDIASARGMTPRQFQAALWTSAKIRQAQTAQEKMTNMPQPEPSWRSRVERQALEDLGAKVPAIAPKVSKEMSYLHSFRPYEGIMQFEHELGEGGKTPLDWVNENRVTLQHLANASEGVTKTRAGDGFTYNPSDFSAYTGDNGIVTTLASVKIPTDKLSAAEVIGFTKKWKVLTDTYPGMNVGTFNLAQAGEPGMTSIDLNVVLPREMLDQARALGASRKQRSLWDLAKSETIDTGYAGETMGAPTNSKERGQWWKKQREEIDEIMSSLDLPSREARQMSLAPVESGLSREQIEPMLQEPHRWGEVAATALGIPEEQVKSLVDAGELHPISDAGMLDHVEVHKDGTIWEFVDPTGPSYNIMKLIGRLGGKRTAEMLGYLEGKNIVTGHDVVQNFRSQAGYVRTSEGPKIQAFARRAPVAKINSAILASQGEVVSPAVLKHSRPQGMSIWLSPTGQIIRVPHHVRNAAAVIKKARLKNPVKYEGPENEVLQTMLNHGYVRVQLHDQAFAADATVPLTGGQVQALRELSRGANGKRRFAGRLTNANGEHRVMIDDYRLGSGALNKYISESRGE